MLLSAVSALYNYISTKLEEEYNHLSLWYFVAFIGGIVIYFSLKVEPQLDYIIASMAICFILLYFSKNNLPARFAVSLAIASIIGISVAKFRVSNLNVPQIEHSIVSQVEGRIESVKPTTTGMQVILRDVAVLKNAASLEKIRLNISSKYMNEISINDEISLLAQLFKPRSNVLPNGYNFGFYNYFAEIGATGYAMSKPVILKTNENETGTIIYRVRKNVYSRLLQILGSLEGNFAAAILLGETRGIDKALMKTMRTTGISHILCVSGLHLTLVAMIFFITTRFILNLSNFISFNFNIKQVAAACSILGSYLYLELSGKQIAATRAFIMTSIIIAAIILGRRAYPLRSIAIAACLILSMNPEYVFHPSFQLSFIAVLSLISGYEFYLKNSQILGSSKGIIATVKLYIFSNIYSSFLASILTAPIVINHFYIFSTYSVLMNLIAVPIMSFFLMPLAIISVVLMPFKLDEYIIKISGFFIDIIIKSANFTAALPGSVWYFGRISSVSLMTFLFGFFWLSLWQTKWRFFGIVIMTAAFIMMLNTKKPDLLFDVQQKIVGITDKQGRLVMYSNAKVSAFTRQFWANWFGQQDVQVLPLKDNYFTLRSGKTVSINYSSKCVEADVQINLNSHCHAKLLAVDMHNVNIGAIIAISCDNKSCRLDRDNNRFNLQ